MAVLSHTLKPSFCSLTFKVRLPILPVLKEADACQDRKTVAARGFICTAFTAFPGTFDEAEDRPAHGPGSVGP